MKRSALTRWEVLLLGPVTLGIVLFGVWASVNAAYTNYVYSRALDQILFIGAVAKDFSVDVRVSNEIATTKFLDRLNEWGVSVVPSSDGRMRVVMTPWGEPIYFVHAPKLKIMRMETKVSSVACRKTLAFLGSNPSGLGLVRADVGLSGLNQIMWRNVHEEAGAQKSINLSLSKSMCESASSVYLGLNFQTR